MQLLQLFQFPFPFLPTAFPPRKSILFNDIEIAFCLLDSHRLMSFNVVVTSAISRLGIWLIPQFLCQLKVVVVIIFYWHRDLLGENLWPAINPKELVISNVFTLNSLVARRFVLMDQVVFCVGSHYLLLRFHSFSDFVQITCVCSLVLLVLILLVFLEVA